MFSKNIRTVYLYLVCLITLFLIIGGLISTIYNISQYIFPNNYNNYIYDYMEKTSNGNISLEDYKVYQDIQKHQREQDLINQKRNNLKDIIYSVAFVIVPLPVYLYNWRKIELDKKSIETTESTGE